MFSQPLMEKWKKLLREKYGFENPTEKEAFQIASTFSGYFSALAEFAHEDKLKLQKYENKYESRKQ